MQVETAVALYAASYVIVLAAVTVQQKRGHTLFPSAACALAICLVWPFMAACVIGLFVYDRCGNGWGKVEDWWNTYPRRDSHAG